MSSHCCCRLNGTVSEHCGTERLPRLLQHLSDTIRFVYPSANIPKLHFSTNFHSQWFGTYNFLDDHLPPPHNLFGKLARQAFIGFVASVISDTVSNSLRVVKTYRQVNEVRIGYFAAAEAVIAQDGLRGLFGRGLKTRIIANGLQGLMFSILWKLFLDL